MSNFAFISVNPSPLSFVTTAHTLIVPYVKGVYKKKNLKYYTTELNSASFSVNMKWDINAGGAQNIETLQNHS